jgi:hypothetical protein
MVSDLLCLNMLLCTSSRERATIRTIQMSSVCAQGKVMVEQERIGCARF